MTHHFDRITKQIIAAIEEGAGEYCMPWHRSGCALEQPINATTGKPYRGLNIVSLWLAASANQFTSGRWASYRQWRAVGAQVRKGAQGTPVFFWRAHGASTEEPTDDNKRRRGFVAKTFVVFNEDQVDGAPVRSPREGQVKLRTGTAHEFFSRLPAQVTHGGDLAYFEPATDVIRIPLPAHFRDIVSYISVRAHETIHWTGVKTRLDRDLSGRFGTSAYAMEELVAELGAAFLCSRLEVCLEPRRDHAAYISSWLKVLRGDNKAVLTAATKAQQAVEFLDACLSSNTSPLAVRA